jgi:zona occludens toxin (predicted ATPase)
MAVSILTGVPGMGKTAYIVSMLLENEAKGAKARPVFVMGIPELKIDHAKCPPVEQWTTQRPDPDDPSLMLDYFTFPPDSIIIIDEAQKIYRNRAATTKVPPVVAALETHRHTGIDIWLLTQKPKQLDTAVREIAGQHIHIRNTMFFGRRLYEWPEYRDVNTEANFKDAAIRKFSPPKKSFDHYKSSEQHTKQKRRLHSVFYFLPVAVAFTLYNGWGIFSKIFGKTPAEVDPITKMAEVQQKQDTGLIPVSVPTSDQQSKQVSAPAEIIHPFSGYDFVIKAQIKSAKYTRTYYEISNGSKSVFMHDQELTELGYNIKQSHECAAFLFFNGASVVATCSTGGDSASARQRGGAFAPAVITNNSPPDPLPRPFIDGSDFGPSPA